jgi:hypothetical protein
MWLPWKLSWVRYELAWRWELWRTHRLHRCMWRHYRRTGRPFVTRR